MKKVYVMLGLAVLLWAATFVVNYDASGKGPDRAPAKETVDEKLPAVEPERVHAIEITDPDNNIRIARVGENWVLPEKFNAPAMAQRATDLLKGLKGLERSERVAKSAGSSKSTAFGLEVAAAKRLKLFDENNKIIVDLWVGKPDMGGERTVQLAGNFVRLEGNDAVYSHPGRLQHLVMPQLSMWIDGRLFPLEPKDLEDAVGKAERVAVEYDDVPMTPGTPDTRPADPSAPRVRIVAEGKEPESQPEPPPTEGPTTPTTPPKPPRKQRDWTLVEPGDADVKPYAPFIEQMLRGLMYARADDVVGSDPTLAEYGLNRPFIEVEARFSDGVTRRLRVGKQAPPPTEPSRRSGTFRYAHVDGVSRVFLINEYTLSAYRKKPAELKQPDAGGRGAPAVPTPIELPKDGAESRR